jgi:hypothetical protein
MEHVDNKLIIKKKQKTKENIHIHIHSQIQLYTSQTECWIRHEEAKLQYAIKSQGTDQVQ